jgi:hypothetical protein
VSKGNSIHFTTGTTTPSMFVVIRNQSKFRCLSLLFSSLSISFSSFPLRSKQCAMNHLEWLEIPNGKIAQVWILNMSVKVEVSLMINKEEHALHYRKL